MGHLYATAWVDRENMLSEISQSEKDGQHRIHLYVESNEQTDNKENTDSERAG